MSVFNYFLSIENVWDSELPDGSGLRYSVHSSDAKQSGDYKGNNFKKYTNFCPSSLEKMENAART